MTGVNSSNNSGALEEFPVDANGLPKQFHTDFNRKLMCGKAPKWILTNKSNVIAALVGCQSSNGLTKHTWRTIIKISFAYVTVKRVGHDFLFYAN